MHNSEFIPLLAQIEKRLSDWGMNSQTAECWNLWSENVVAKLQEDILSDFEPSANQFLFDPLKIRVALVLCILKRANGDLGKNGFAEESNARGASLDNLLTVAHLLTEKIKDDYPELDFSAIAQSVIVELAMWPLDRAFDLWRDTVHTLLKFFLTSHLTKFYDVLSPEKPSEEERIVGFKHITKMSQMWPAHLSTLILFHLFNDTCPCWEEVNIKSRRWAREKCLERHRFISLTTGQNYQAAKPVYLWDYIRRAALGRMDLKYLPGAFASSMAFLYFRKFLRQVRTFRFHCTKCGKANASPCKAGNCPIKYDSSGLMLEVTKNSLILKSLGKCESEKVGPDGMPHLCDRIILMGKGKNKQKCDMCSEWVSNFLEVGYEEKSVWGCKTQNSRRITTNINGDEKKEKHFFLAANCIPKCPDDDSHKHDVCPLCSKDDPLAGKHSQRPSKMWRKLRRPQETTIDFDRGIHAQHAIEHGVNEAEAEIEYDTDDDQENDAATDAEINSEVEVVTMLPNEPDPSVPLEKSKANFRTMLKSEANYLSGWLKDACNWLANTKLAEHFFLPFTKEGALDEFTSPSLDDYLAMHKQLKGLPDCPKTPNELRSQWEHAEGASAIMKQMRKRMKRTSFNPQSQADRP